MTKACEKFLEALEEEGNASALDCFQRHSSRSDDLDLAEVLQSLPKKDYKRFGAALEKKVAQALDSLPSAEENGDTPPADDPSVTLLIGAASVALLMVSELGAASKHAPSELLSAAAMLHDRALLSAEDFPALQEAVSKLCEAWWAKDLPGKESLVPQTVPYLLVKALASGKASDVKRVYGLRAALLLFDFDDESIASLKRLLLRCAFAPPFLRAADGRRLVSSLFSLHPQMARELVAIIKNQIPAGRKSVLDAYGDILYRAWRTASGPTVYELEYNGLQPLMEAALHASTPALAAALRRVLDGFHGQKRQRGVDEMLLRLYEPILFRALAAANGAVRRNAAHVLVDAFPLQDPAAPAEEADSLLQKQFKILTTLLKDDAPAVRQVAVEGVCSVLRVYWEMVPAATAVAFMAKLVDDLAHDAASAAVRAAVVSGISALVDLPLAQPALKACLPRMGGLLSDSAPKVRVAMADLLLTVRSVRAIKFFEVVPVEKLLDSLESDQAPVASRIARLLLPSYLPPAAGPEEAAGRLLMLFSQHPGAAAAMCRHAPAVGADPSVCWDVVELLRDHLIAGAPRGTSSSPTPPPPAKGKGGKRKSRAPATPVAAREDEDAEEIDPEMWEAISVGLRELCLSLMAAGHEAPGGVFAGELLQELLAAGPTPEARAAVLRMAAAIPADGAPSRLLQSCRRQLADASGGAMSEEDFSAIACVCAWGGASELAGQVEDALARPLPDAAASATPKSSKRAKPAHEMGMLGAAKTVLALLGEEGTRRAMVDGGHLAAFLPRLLAGAKGAVAAPEASQGEGTAASMIMACGKAALHILLAARAPAHSRGDFTTPFPAGGRGGPDAEEAAASALGEMMDAVAEAMAEWDPPSAPAAPAAPARAGRGRKGKAAPAPPAAAAAPVQIVEAVAALSAEAAALGLLDDTSEGGPRARAAALAAAAFEWIAGGASSAQVWAPLAAHLARLARHLTASGPITADVEAVATAALEAMARGGEEAVAACKPHAAAFLPRLVAAGKARWVGPVARALAQDTAEDEGGMTSAPLPRAAIAALRGLCPPAVRAAAAVQAARHAADAVAAAAAAAAEEEGGREAEACGAVELARQLCLPSRGRGAAALPPAAEESLRALYASSCGGEAAGEGAQPLSEALQRVWT